MTTEHPAAELLRAIADGKRPKQWAHWVEAAGLRRHGKKPHRRYGFSGPQKDLYYLKGRGYVWRLNCRGELERGDTYQKFDRWALCRIYAEPMPKTQTEFLAFVQRALADSRKHRD